MILISDNLLPNQFDSAQKYLHIVFQQTEKMTKVAIHLVTADVVLEYTLLRSANKPLYLPLTHVYFDKI